MKIFTKSILITFLSCSLLMATSCKKDDDGGGTAASSGEFTAKVNGNNYESFPEATAAQLSGAGEFQAMAVSGGTMDSENIQFIITGFDGVGTYSLNFVNIGTYSYLPDPSNPDPNTVVVFTTVGNAQGNNGEVNISTFDDTTVSGTFSFTGYNLDNIGDTVSVTNGAFNVAYTRN
ncbi:DUF6252 family protein [Ulvibacter litoralis]|uniref:Uncharacterized protein n=1 Tax=Ulvibacter litoralis TaxID=227084 RepID=A0A1G7C828_9FLAO|nr:DUF6252 family protein [Ulvibacter litoralis]SDE35363.1 hypothetical protein SAMN05421855_101231 [Ulvibacter litoralis]